MPNFFVNLPVPTSNAAGAKVDVSAMGKTKTIIVGGPFDATVGIEFSTDDLGVHWAPVPNATFVGNPGNVTIEFAAKWMRAVTSAYRGGTPNADVGGSSAGSIFVKLPAPVSGVGAAVDISGMPELKSVICSGGLIVEVSQDGNSWAQMFSFNNQGQQTGVFFAQFARLRGSGPDAWLGGAEDDDANPGQPVFEEDRNIWIYARLTGSDASGNGTLDSPYRTFQRAIRDVPTELPAGTYYHVDITGLGLEQLPQGYTFPAFRGADDVAGLFDFDQEFFSCLGLVNIQADPKLASVAGLTTVPAGVVTADPTTGMKAIQVAGAGWTPGELVGKLWITSSVGPHNGIIWKNTADTVWVTQKQAPLFPCRIMEPSAQLQADRAQTPLAPVPDLHYGAVNVFNSQVALLGLKINATPTVPNPTTIDFQNFGLHISGTTPRVSMQLCDLPCIGVTTDGWGYVRICYLPQALFLNAPLLIINSMLHRSMSAGGPTNYPGPGLTFFGGRGVDSLIRQTVFLETNTLMFRDLFDIFAAFTVPNLLLVECQFLNQTGSLPLGHNDGNADGIHFVGSLLRAISCDISRDDGGLGGSAIVAKGNCAQVYLTHVTGTGFARFGIEIQDGAYVVLQDAPGGAPAGATTITGVMGDASVGFVGATAYAAVAAPYAGGAGDNVADFASPKSQGCRFWRES